MAILVTALAGAWLGIVLGGPVQTPVGPAEVGMALRPSWEGGTVVDVRPLGTLRFESHRGPVQLRLTIDGIRTSEARKLIGSPRAIEALSERVQEEIKDGLNKLAWRAGAFALIGAALAGGIVFRSWRRTGWTVLTATAGVAAMGVVAALTFQPQSISEPRYTGLLEGAPKLVGNAETIVARFDVYRAQLAKLVTNVSQLYQVTSTLPEFQPDPTTIRVLHVSDIHINPAAWNVIHSVVGQFRIDMIIDTGDITDHGSGPEDQFVGEISRVGVPYVYVRGNHDSLGTQRAVARQKGAIVLDGAARSVAGLTIYGVGDPMFTPDKSVTVPEDPVALSALGRSHAVRLPPSVDMVAVHSPSIARGFSGYVPTVVTGHTHRRATELMFTGTRMLVQGSTGGAGLRALEKAEPTPIMASVLYFNRTTRRLQAWDDITLGGLGLQSAMIERHVEQSPSRTIHPAPSSGSGSPIPTSPSVSPSASSTGPQG